MRSNYLLCLSLAGVIATILAVGQYTLNAAEPYLAWSAFYDGGTGGTRNDAAKKVVVDSSGNVHVTGTLGAGINFGTLKYTSAGVGVWTNIYNGPGNGNDKAAAMAVDAVGNVYVTGDSVGSSGYSDYVIVKYFSDGTPGWTNRYGGTANRTNQPTAVAIDNSGAVYVTGFAIGSDSGADYPTIKYLPDGTAAWTNIYNGSGNQNDQAEKWTPSLGPRGALFKLVFFEAARVVSFRSFSRA